MVITSPYITLKIQVFQYFPSKYNAYYSLTEGKTPKNVSLWCIGFIYRTKILDAMIGFIKF